MLEVQDKKYIHLVKFGGDRIFLFVFIWFLMTFLQCVIQVKLQSVSRDFRLSGRLVLPKFTDKYYSAAVQVINFLAVYKQKHKIKCYRVISKMNPSWCISNKILFSCLTKIRKFLLHSIPIFIGTNTQFQVLFMLLKNLTKIFFLVCHVKCRDFFDPQCGELRSSTLRV